MSDKKIIYTITDEAPALATGSFLPMVEGFASQAGIKVETRDISLAARIIAQFSDRLPKDKQKSDDLKELGQLAKTPVANIIKLPNISASIPQLTACIRELQAKGYGLPDFPDDPQNAEEKDIHARYSVALGSAVNPVLREGNSDRRVALPVKEYAKANPHSMGEWSQDSKSHVAFMSEGDFFGSEVSTSMDKEETVQIIFQSANGETKVLKQGIKLQAKEVIDASFMSADKLREFLKGEIEDAKNKDILFSLHLKATMMKVSDPIIFGHGISVFFSELFEKHGTTFEEIGFEAKNGMGDLLTRLETLSGDVKKKILDDIDAIYKKQPAMAMVDSDKGITNLHVPSDVIIDASMPAMIRSSGKMWGPDGKLKDCKAVIPDRSYSRIYQETMEFCRKHGAFDPKTMGNVSNVGLMAQKAEEYGSHDKTFEIFEEGQVLVQTEAGKTIFTHSVSKGDIWRMCQTKDLPIQDWVKLAVSRAKATGNPAVFWLDEKRAHDKSLIGKVESYLKNHDTAGLEIKILSPVEAMKFTLARVKEGQDTISVTGNVLRDYLTDLFPILELGTSAKMLSIVPLLSGGGLYETGAGGSAPKHVQQFVSEGHLRWDSLGEFLALSVSLEDCGEKNNEPKAKILADTLTSATSRVLNEGKSPLRKVNQLDNRGSHFYLVKFWAEALAAQSADESLRSVFSEVSAQLNAEEGSILEQLNASQGSPVELDGYFMPNSEKLGKAMRPSASLNKIIDSLRK